MLHAGVFGERYFAFWVALSLIWGLCGAGLCTIMPVIESRTIILRVRLLHTSARFALFLHLVQHSNAGTSHLGWQVQICNCSKMRSMCRPLPKN